MKKWLVGQSTVAPVTSFDTKREAIAFARENVAGIFIVWKRKVKESANANRNQRN